MKFVMSYSCGKDSTLALHKMLEQGHEAVALIVMVNEPEGRSYFHGADPSLLERYSKALELPLILCPASGSEDYRASFVEGLKRAKSMGAEAACFGDIDIEQNRLWEEESAALSGLEAQFPLWQRGRRENVTELIDLGYRCLIKSINNKILPIELLGTDLNRAAVTLMEASGADVCGENGEYHTLTLDGPIFRKPVAVRIGKRLDFGDYSVVEIE